MFKYGDKVLVSGIEKIGTIVGEGGRNGTYIVLFDDFVYDSFTQQTLKYKAIVVWTGCITSAGG